MSSAAGRRGRGIVAPPPNDEPSASQSSATRDPSNVEDDSTSVSKNQQYTKWAKKRSRDYKKLMPYMRKYKKAILACWEDGAHTFRLQPMPLQIQDIQYVTTCGYPYCPLEDGIMEPGTLRVSIERNEHPDSEVDWSQRIPLQPSQQYTPAWREWPDGVPNKGKGKEVKHWLCLKCLEDLWMEATGFDDTTDDKLHLPQMGDLSILRPETRTQGPDDKLYNLPSPQVYALAKWAAVIRYQDYIDPLHKAEAAQCFKGEPGTLYEDLQTLNMRGIDELTGARVEISADQIRSPAIAKFGTRPIKPLSDVLDWVDNKVEKVREEVAEISQTPRTIPKRLAHASTHPRTKANDSHGKIKVAATSLATSGENEAEDEPNALLSFPGTPRRQRRPALTTPNMTPSSKRRVRDSPEDTIALSSSPLSILDNKENEAQEAIAPASEDVVSLTSSEEELLAYMVPRAGPAVNRASNDNLQGNVHQCMGQ